MAFESMARVKELQERLTNRIHNIKKHAEEGARVAFAAVEINGAAAAWGYMNERWGKAPDNDPSGLKEVMFAGIPADLGVGVLGEAGEDLHLAGEELLLGGGKAGQV